jgi:nitronate monooxygenase
MPFSLQDLLAMDLPIIQAPMAGVQGGALAVAMSSAGGLASLPWALLGMDAMRSELAAFMRRAASRSTSTSSATPCRRRTQSARPGGGPLLALYFHEYGIDADDLPAAR